MKLVSIIIPMYNRSKYIEECINSVIHQTYKNLEIIIIDDASTDNSVEIVKSINDDRIKIIKLEKNLGASNARNIGIKNAKGKYICFLDSDDYWVLDKLETQVNFIEKNNYSFIYASYEYLSPRRRHKAKVPTSLTYEKLLKNHAIFTSTVMLNMNYLKKDDIYMPDIKIGEDYATWYKILKLGITAHGVSKVLSFYRIGEESLSANKIKSIYNTWKQFKRENLKLSKRIICFICYLFNAIKRRII